MSPKIDEYDGKFPGDFGQAPPGRAQDTVTVGLSCAALRFRLRVDTSTVRAAPVEDSQSDAVAYGSAGECRDFANGKPAHGQREHAGY